MAEEGRIYVGREIEVPDEFEEPVKFILGPECAIGERIPNSRARTRGFQLRCNPYQVVVVDPFADDPNEVAFEIVAKRSAPTRPFLVPFIDRTGAAIGVPVYTYPVKVYSHDDEHSAPGTHINDAYEQAMRRMAPL